MDTVAYNEAKRHLLTAINHIAPNGAVQRKFVDTLHELELSGATNKETLKVLTGKLYDGLAYGNW